MSNNRFILAFLLLLATLLSSCGRETNLTIEDGNPPKFIVSGSGIVDFIRVTGTDLRAVPEGGLTYTDTYWEIIPKEEIRVEDLGKLNPIIYGKAPKGFSQINPKSGEAHELFEGGKFGVQLSVRNGHGVNKIFTLHNGQIVSEGQ
jgi:hypothetical protein